MRIARIELTGFKSFRDRTTLILDSGINAIVGPNGCGKSNVVDAVRWALGEQSAKTLRGGKMQDIIFAGSDGAKPAAFAEVKLTFEVGDDELAAPHHRAGDVTIGRRLTRSGDSSYIVNGNPARLMDIQGIFLGTGAGLSSYSIIEQGAVGFIVTARPHERRSLIEEAAGISRYKSQRRTSERNLQATEQNLERVDDLYREVTRQVSSLKRQARRAEQFDALQTEERQLGLLAWLWERRALHGRLAAAQRQAEVTEDERKKIEAEQRAMREEFAIARFELDQLRKRHETVVEQCLRIEARQQLLGGNIEHAQRDIVQTQGTLEENTERLEHLSIRATEATTERERIEAQVTELEDIRPRQQQVAGLKESLDERRQQLQSAGQTLSRLRQIRQQLDAQITRTLERLRGLGEASSRLEERRLRIAEDAQHIAAELAMSTRNLDDARRNLDDAREESQRAEERFGALRDEVTRCTRAADDAHANDRAISDRVIRLEATLRTLEAVAPPEPSRKRRDDALVALAARAQRLPLAAMLHVPREHEQRLAGALAGDLDALWVDPETPLEVLEALLNPASGIDQRLVVLGAQAEDDDAAILPLNVSPLPPPGEKDPTRRAHTQSTLRAWLRQRLERVEWVEDDLVTRWRAGERPAPGRRWVDPRGRCLEADGTLHRFGASNASDMLERARRTRSVREQLVTAKREASVAAAGLQTSRDALTGARDLFEDASSRFEEARAFLTDARGLHREAELRHEALAEQNTRSERERDVIEDEAARYDEEQYNLEESRQKLVAEQTERAAEQAELEAHLGQHQQHAQTLERDVHQAQMDLTRLEAQRQARLESLAQARRLEASILDQIRRLTLEQTSLTQRLGERREQRTRDQAELARIESQATSSGEDRAALEKQLEGLSKTLAEQESALQSLEGDLRAIATQHEAASIEATRAEATIETLDRQNVERYNVSIVEGREEIKDQLDADFDDSARARLNKIRIKLRRFGEVNTGAIRAFKEASERETQIREQREDLLKAVADLKRAIARIDQTCRKRFKETFDAVDQSFREIFPRLFSGGRAQLVLTEPDDLLTSGVDIVAQPPGKRLQVLSLLSGGEKAMTAVALMTALFLLRPAPFCILDEVDAPLDDINVTRFTRLLTELTEHSQLLVVTHNRLTMRVAERLYGVTMQRDGMSQLLSIKLGEFPERHPPPQMSPALPFVDALPAGV